jgi:hypothetical protein
MLGFLDAVIVSVVDTDGFRLTQYLKSLRQTQ